MAAVTGQGDSIFKTLIEVKGMMKRNKVLRIALSSTLLLAVVAAGVTMYRSENSVKKQEQNQAEEQQMAEETPLSELSQGQEDAMKSGGGDDTADVNASDAQAENTESLTEGNQDGEADSAPGTQTPEGTPAGEETAGTQEEQQAQDGAASDDASQDAAAQVQPELNFTEDSTLLWPVNGQVLIDYSMDATTYFPTLDLYKYNPSVVMAAASGDPVQAAANSQVLSITENEETGVTLTMDMGNGYQAVYGQLKDVAVQEGQTVEAGAIIGYISDPTKYYVEEGSNLYFAMTRDGEPVDPMIYIETVVE